MYDDYWVVNNALNGQDDFDDVEAYEGFSSCGSHYWDSANGLMSANDWHAKSVPTISKISYNPLKIFSGFFNFTIYFC